MGVTNYIFKFLKYFLFVHSDYTFLVVAKDFSHILPYFAFIVSIKSIGQGLTLLSKEKLRVTEVKVRIV